MNTPNTPEASDYELSHPGYRELDVINERDPSMKMRLIKPDLAHASASLGFLSEEEVWKYLGGDYSGISIESENERLQKILNDEDAYHWMIEVNGRIVGNINVRGIAQCSATDKCRAGWIGIIIGDKTLWGKGISRSLISAVCDWAFHEAKFERIDARIMPENIGSMKSFASVGFKQFGTEDEEVDGKTIRWNHYALKKEDVL